MSHRHIVRGGDDAPLINLPFQHGARFHRERIGREVRHGKALQMSQIVIPISLILAWKGINEIDTDIAESLSESTLYGLKRLLSGMPAIEQSQIGIVKRLHPYAEAVKKAQTTKTLQKVSVEILGVGLDGGLFQNGKVVICLNTVHNLL